MFFNNTEHQTRRFRGSPYLILIYFMERGAMLPRNNPYLKWIRCCKRNNCRKIACLTDQNILGLNLTKAALSRPLKNLLHAVEPGGNRWRDKWGSQHLAVWMCHWSSSRRPVVLKHLRNFKTTEISSIIRGIWQHILQATVNKITQVANDIDKIKGSYYLLVNFQYHNSTNKYIKIWILKQKLGPPKFSVHKSSIGKSGSYLMHHQDYLN